MSQLTREQAKIGARVRIKEPITLQFGGYPIDKRKVKMPKEGDIITIDAIVDNFFSGEYIRHYIRQNTETGMLEITILLPFVCLELASENLCTCPISVILTQGCLCGGQ